VACEVTPIDVITIRDVLASLRHVHGSFTRCICPTSGTMRTVLLFGRQCLRQGLPKYTARAYTRPFTHASSIRRQFATPRFKGRTISWSGAATGVAGGAILSPLAFVDVANDKSGNGEKTHEEAMLEVSRKELDEQVPHALKNSRKYRRGIYFFVEDYIIEPIATGLRFLHLVFIFVPVIVTIPAMWIGARQADKDDERSGTIWWYGFLVGSMERAGAAFIKV
jgi:aarF domain-containing kinase